MRAPSGLTERSAWKQNVASVGEIRRKLSGSGAGAAGIGAGLTGNMDGKCYIKNGNIEVYAAVGGAGIGGGMETDNTGAGGEGGDVYIGGGTLKVFSDGYSDAQAIGYGWQLCPFGTDPSGSVYISSDKNTTGKYMRVAYSEDNGATYKIANKGDRSSKCHKDECILFITECDHHDNDGLSYSINSNGTHTESCKYCGYEARVAHTEPDCVCGYRKPTNTVTLNSLDGINLIVLAKGSTITLPYATGDIVAGNTVPTLYYAVTGWKDVSSNTTYEAGSDITVTADMEFTLLTDPVYSVECTETENGRISPDLSTAKAGEPVKVKVLPDTGYSVSSVTYTYIVDYDYQSSSFIYADPVQITDVDGLYQLVMPALSGPANGIVISAVFTKNTEQSVLIIPATTGETEILGTVAADTESAMAGTLVTLTVTPAEGCSLRKIHCMTVNDAEVELTRVSDTCYTFTMPAYSVIVSADFDKLSNWKMLQEKIEGAGNGATITLDGNCTAAAFITPGGR
ncbi:MAG: hypothetical protein J6Y48_03470 [Clostridia bacterium]|nr:hypothetical protein [Clostridia bacterium]